MMGLMMMVMVINEGEGDEEADDVTTTIRIRFMMTTLLRDSIESAASHPSFPSGPSRFSPTCANGKPQGHPTESDPGNSIKV